MAGRERFEDFFEGEWREAFDGYEEAPPSTVWTNIDRDLAYGKMLAYKRSARVYKLLAAAVVLLAFSLALFRFDSFGLVRSSDQELLSLKSEGQPRVLPNENTTAAIRQTEITESQLTKSISAKTDNSADQIESNGQEIQETNASSLAAFSKTVGSVPKQRNLDPKDAGLAMTLPSDIKDRIDFEQLSSVESIKIDYSQTVASNHGNVEMWKTADYSYLNRGKKNRAKVESKEERRLWAGLDFGSGSFDPNYQTTNGNALNNSFSEQSLNFSSVSSDAVQSRSPSVDESMSAGNSLSLGLQLGVDLGDRWTLSSGVQYNQSDAVNRTNIVVQTTAVQEPIPASQEFRMVAPVNQAIQQQEVLEYDFRDVNLNNEFQFASVPLRAGYKLIDQKLSLELNAGVAANIYLGNRLTDPTEEFADVTIGPGSNSPYRELSFSGLAGVQVGYLLMNRLELTLQPNYQQSLNTLTKEDAGFSAVPSGFGLLTGLRYRFR